MTVDMVFPFDRGAVRMTVLGMDTVVVESALAAVRSQAELPLRPLPAAAGRATTVPTRLSTVQPEDFPVHRRKIVSNID